MATKQETDELIRALTEKNLVAKFASDILHCDHLQTDVFTKACADRFEYDGLQLVFKGANGPVPATDEQCTGFFQREYAFLLPAKSVQQKLDGLDANLIASAKLGNLTAKGQLYKKLYQGKGSEAATDQQLANLLSGKSSTEDGERQRDDKGRFVDTRTKNPFLGANWNLTEQSRLVRADPALAARLADAAGVKIGSTRPAKVA